MLIQSSWTEVKAAAPTARPKPSGEGVSKEVSQEMLNEAQSIVKTLLDVADNLTSKITLILGQAITLATASFGAASLVFPANGAGKSWLPVWGAVGFVTAGIVWVAAAFLAFDGLKPRNYTLGFFTPDEFAQTTDVKKDIALVYFDLAQALQPIIDFDAAENKKLYNRLGWSRLALTLAPVLGALAAAVNAFLS